MLSVVAASTGLCWFNLNEYEYSAFNASWNGSSADGDLFVTVGKYIVYTKKAAPLRVQTSPRRTLTTDRWVVDTQLGRWAETI